MNKKKFPWIKLLFAFLIGLVLGVIYPPLESISLPWFILIIAIPFAAILYVIAEAVFAAFLEDLKQFLGEFMAVIVCVLIFIGGFLVGSLIFNWLTVLIQSLTA